MEKDKRESRRLLLFALLAVTAGLVYFFWGQYNTALTLYEVGFLGRNAEMALAQDEAWAIAEADEAAYRAALDRGAAWAAERAGNGEVSGGSFENTALAPLDERLPARRMTLSYTHYKQAGGKTVILLHGYRDGPAEALAWAPDWWDAGYSVVIPVQRGYEQRDAGNSVPTTFGVYEQYDLYDLICALELREDTLLVHGKGAGAAAALLMAADPALADAGLDGVVAESVYDDLGGLMREQVKRQFGLGDFLCGRFLRFVVRDRLGFEPDSVRLTAAAAEIAAPVLFICSEGDAFLGADHTRAVCEAKQTGQASLTVLDAPYRLLWSTERDRYWESVRAMFG